MAAGWEDEGLLWSAVSDALAPLVNLEGQPGWDANKIEKRIRDYFKKGAKGLEFGSKSFTELVNDYADAVFSSLLCGMGDRPWLHEADFLLALDAGIKDYFPAFIVQKVSQAEFERVIYTAHDRAFEEQRYMHFCWETVTKIIAGKSSQKKVREALDAARGEAVAASLGDSVRGRKVQDFVGRWIMSTFKHLDTSTHGEAEGTLPESEAIELFHALVQESSLPASIIAEEGPPPPGWDFIDFAVREAFRQRMPAAAKVPPPPAKRPKRGY